MMDFLFCCAPSAQSEAPPSNQLPDIGGVGIAFRPDKNSNALFVDSFADNSPAKFSGAVMIGDRLLRVDDVEVSGMHPADIQRVIRGPVGSPVKLVFQHSNGQCIALTMERVPGPGGVDRPPSQRLSVNHPQISRSSPPHQQQTSQNIDVRYGEPDYGASRAQHLRPSSVMPPPPPPQQQMPRMAGVQRMEQPLTGSVYTSLPSKYSDLPHQAVVRDPYVVHYAGMERGGGAESSMNWSRNTADYIGYGGGGPQSRDNSVRFDSSMRGYDSTMRSTNESRVPALQFP